MHRHLLLPIFCLLAAPPAWAVKVERVQIEGLRDDALRDNVRSVLSLSREMDRSLRPRRLDYLLSLAPTEVRRALEPFGYYDVQVDVLRSDAGSLVNSSADDGSDEMEALAEEEALPSSASTLQETTEPTVTVTLLIATGAPIQVRSVDVGVDGPAASDTEVAAAVAAFQPRPGAVLFQPDYTASKSRIADALARRGYFDAHLRQHQVTIHRAEHAADIVLRWSSGTRMSLGPVQFVQTPQPILSPQLLQQLVPWTPGQPFDATQIDRLRDALLQLEDFGLVDIQADPAHAQDGQIPVQATLTPARRSLYSAGLSYGTATGAGIRLGLERRYLNRYGHKVLTQIDWAQKRKTATLQYRIPAFAWMDGWYNVSLQAGDEQTAYIDSRRLELALGRTGEYSQHLAVSASVHALRERWTYASTLSTAPVFLLANFAFPELRGDYIDVDDRLAPRRGGGLSVILRGGGGGARGRTGFFQMQARGQWFRGLGLQDRLIARGELGHTFTGDVLDLPPSLRFYAGGDRSVRGYGWHELGPRILTSGGVYYTGAPNVLTASLEYERIVRGPWGAAIFVDTGNAFSGRRPDLHTGIGIGLRWRSPVGPVRIDIARGLNAPDAPLTLSLNIGPGL